MKKVAVIIFACCLCTACSSQDIAGVTTAGALVVASPVMTPASEIYHGIKGVERHLGVYEAYRIGDQKYVFRNEYGWFTDQSERQPRGESKRYQSAWVVDLKFAETDEKGRIILSESNLVRWFFRDNNVQGWTKLLRNPQAPTDEYYTSTSNQKYITLYTSTGSSHVLYLKQK